MATKWKKKAALLMFRHLERNFSVKIGIWAWQLGLGPGSKDWGLIDEIWAWQLGFWPDSWEFLSRGWDLGLVALPWAWKLGFWPEG